ncbi:MAG: DUF5117 domain-containing protein [Ignavibacteriae bacterium]|nr:MAG: DUF5117 domain-containing protein [Ignavibacteriota bacterium]
MSLVARVSLLVACSSLLVACGSSTSTQSSSQTSSQMKADSATSKSKIQAYAKVITKDAVSDSGLFIVHRISDQFFYEIPNNRLGEEFLLVSRTAKTPQVGYGGEELGTSVVRWERKYDKILLRTVSYENVAADSTPISRAVKASNFEEIVEAFPIKAYNKDTSAVVIDVTSLFTTDVSMLTPDEGTRKGYKITRLDKERSFIEYAKSFPTNIEVENVITFAAGESPQNRSSGAMSFTMHHSMVELPKKPMTPRLADDRVGFFALRQTDYGREENEATSREYILRWRLEPKDTAAFLRGELVEPIKPITYYIDPATPLKWRSWLKKGVESWNPAFESAGFKNAVRVIEAPTKEEDPDWAPEDARYSVIRYYPSPTENAYGPNIHDPRTGEIIESDIGWFHNIMKLQTGWFFAQAVSDPRSRKLPYDDSLMGELIATVAAHEFGHTIGMPHNMKASSAYPVDSLRSKTFCAKYGTAPTIMDYARYNYIAQPGDDVDVFPKVGPYDHFSVKWGYRPIIGATTSDAELDTLHAWAKLTETNKMYRFGAQQWMTLDPSSQTEDLGDDPVKAGTYGVANLKRAMGYVLDATRQDGKDFRLLDEAYDDLFAQWTREMGHVANVIGGVEIERKVFGSKEGPVYTPVSKERQKAAIAFLGEQVFTTPTWLLDQRIVDLLTPSGAPDRLATAQTRFLRTTMSNDKLVRMIEQETRTDITPYTVTELFDDLEKLIFTELQQRKPVDYYRRSLQRSYVDGLIAKTKKPDNSSLTGFARFFAGPDVYNSDVRALVRARLAKLQTSLKGAGTDPVSKAHFADLSLQIQRALDPSAE